MHYHPFLLIASQSHADSVEARASFADLRIAVYPGFAEAENPLLAGFGTWLFANRDTDLRLRPGGAETDLRLAVPSGAAASVPASYEIIDVITDGPFVAIQHVAFTPLMAVVGPLEDTGRLRYIDGCSDTLLIPPVYYGSPCLNALWFPAGTVQTMHTHPSTRVGIVYSGAGVCEWVDPSTGQTVSTDLTPGAVFVIPTDCPHRFCTAGSPMVVAAFHPDSDYGPTDLHHPMIQKTIVGGISASDLPEIQTR